MSRNEIIDAAMRRVRKLYPLSWNNCVRHGELWVPFICERARAEYRKVLRLQAKGRDVRGRFA